MSNTLKITAFTINLFLLTINIILAQPAVWSTTGNNVQGPFSNAFLGTTNDAPLIFKTNGQEVMRLTEEGDVDFAPGTQLNLMGTANLDTIVSKYINTASLFSAFASINSLNSTIINNSGTIETDMLNANAVNTGSLKAASLSGTGTELLKVSSNGTFERFSLSNNFNDVLRGDGNFSLAAWSVLGNDIFSSYPGNTGIGLSNPSEKLEVNGNAKINGTLFANDIDVDQMLDVENLNVSGNLTTDTLTANNASIDKIHVTGELKIGNSIIFPAGTNKMYTDATVPTDLLIQSESGFNNNTIINNSNTGRVAIGISVPDEKLHVGGSNQGDGAQFGNAFVGNGVLPSVIFSHSNFKDDANKYAIRHVSDGTLYINSANNQSLFFRTNNVTRMRIFAVNGNIGIGTGDDMPEVRLHVKGTGIHSQIIRAQNGERRIFLVPHLGFAGYNGITQDGDAGIFWSDAAVLNNGDKNLNAGFVIAPHIEGTGGIRMDNLGNVNVCGNLRTNRIIVETGWCDYVFEEDYKRMSWKEKADYYSINKHLPGVKSGKEIEENGLEVGENMQGMMLNIEENRLDLTDIYMQIEVLKTENVELKKAINDLLTLMKK